MDHLTCDLCGKALLTAESVRYEVRIQVYAAYHPLELTPDDLRRDQRPEIHALLDRLRNADPTELEESVYKEFLFDLCMACQRRYVCAPLARAAAPAEAAPDAQEHRLG